MADGALTRDRIVAAAYACMARDGVGDITLEAVAREAGVARATVYRSFPGGRDEVIGAAIIRGVGEFFERLRADLGEVRDVAALLEGWLLAAHRRVAENTVLQGALVNDAGQIVPPLARAVPIVAGLLRDELATLLREAPLRPGVEVGEGADLLARMALSFAGAAGCWDLDDPVAVRRLVRDQLLPGVIDTSR